jgi:guanyl-specific ribonuclease Sa
MSATGKGQGQPVKAARDTKAAHVSPKRTEGNARESRQVETAGTALEELAVRLSPQTDQARRKEPVEIAAKVELASKVPEEAPHGVEIALEGPGMADVDEMAVDIQTRVETVNAAETETGRPVVEVAGERAAQVHPKEEEMATEKETGASAKAAKNENLDVLESVIGYFTKGFERLAEVQKKALDQATQHNAEFAASWKKQANGFPEIPGIALLDIANTIVERSLETQKGAIDLVVEQGQAWAGMAKERAAQAAKPIEGGATAVQEAVEQTVSAQKTAIDYSANQAKAAIASTKQLFGLAGTPLEAATESWQRGLDVLVGTQKELLDIMKGQIRL